MRENLDDEITEVKSENAIDRITSQANPRTLERVPAGARFQVRMVLDVLCEEDKALAARLLEGLRLLEDDALGGGGSRGSGRVRFANLKLSLAQSRVLFVGRRRSRACLRRGSGRGPGVWPTTRLSAKSWRAKHDRRSSDPPAAHRAVAHRPRFRRSRSRGSHLSQRFALLRGVAARWRASGCWTNGWMRPRAHPSPRCASVPAFRFTGETLFVVPPRTVASAGVVQGALEGRAIRSAQRGRESASRAAGRMKTLDRSTAPANAWCPHGAAGSVSSPSVRSSAAVDREGDERRAAFHRVPGIHSRQRIVVGGGVSERRRARAVDAAALTAAFRLLADSGFGGERSRGWGRAEMPEIADGNLPDLLLTNRRPARPRPATGCCRLFHPGACRRGRLAARQLFADHARRARRKRCGWGDVKKTDAHGGRRIGPGGFRANRAARPPMSRRMSFAHPVYRAGFALAIPIPLTPWKDRRMKYRVTCLTPTLVGDGQKLAPIDYMVWKDHVNVLDQRRIFRLLAKGPRLDGYLAQLKKADKLDFASWGGFAQNFAGRRIPFEHPSAIPAWRTRAGRKSIHSDLRRCRPRSVPSRHRDQGRAAHRRRVRPLDRSDHARSGRAHRRKIASRAIPRRKPKTPCWADPGTNRMRRLSAGGFDAHPLIRHESLSAARLDSDRPGRGQVRARLEIAARLGRCRAHRRQHADLRRDGRARNRLRRIVAGALGWRSGEAVSRPPTATPPR